MILQLTKAVAENISMTSKTITFKILQSAIKLRPSMQLISLQKISYYSSTTIKSEISSPISFIDLHLFKNFKKESYQWLSMTKKLQKSKGL